MTTKRQVSAQYEQVLYLALAQPIGLAIQCGSDFAAARARLYTARAALNDPALRELQFRPSPFPDANLLIVKRRVAPKGKEVELI